MLNFEWNWKKKIYGDFFDENEAVNEADKDTNFYAFGKEKGKIL